MFYKKQTNKQTKKKINNIYYLIPGIAATKQTAAHLLHKHTQRFSVHAIHSVHNLNGRPWQVAVHLGGCGLREHARTRGDKGCGCGAGNGIGLLQLLDQQVEAVTLSGGKKKRRRICFRETERNS